MPMPRAVLRFALPALLAACAFPVTAKDALRTVAEASGFRQTARYAETIDLCARFQAAYPDAVRCSEFGRTPEGRPMLALVASRSGALDPVAARERGLPVVLVQGGIHAGEIDGKDAGFLALRQALDGKAAPGALEKLVLVFVPVFNVDGHERFGRWNRPNQRGPEEMGWRTTAQNYNLNRDYAKADTREMQQMLALVERWDPLAVVDLHVTNGAKFRHDISIQVEPVNAGDAALRAAGRAWRDGVIADLRAAGSLPLAVYPSFATNDDPTSGITDGVAAPRFSHGYFWLRNRLAMLVETHSWKDYPTRVRITRNTVVSVLERIARHGAAWRAEMLAADARSAALAGQPVDLEFRATDAARTIDFLGYAYTRTPSDVSGALMTRYDERTPQTWKMPLRDQLAPSLTIAAPRAGYVVPAEHAPWVGRRLSQHGIDWRPMRGSRSLRGQSFRATKVGFGAQSVEGHQRATLAGDWADEERALADGAIFVPIAQPRARLAIALLEPRATDSLAAWGLFNNAFEQKEYMEDYVAEDVAREQLAADPALRGEFERRLREDAAFAADPAARLAFFARRHASWDTRYNLYPVFRVDVAPDR